MPTKHSSQAARERRRHEDRERVEVAVAQLTDSDGWKRWVRVRSRNGLARYSLHNQLLIALQRPDASYVAGFKAFLALDRCVRRGEKGIRILAPIPRKAVGARETETPGSDDGRSRPRFGSVTVFDVAQTEPLPGSDPVSLQAPTAPVTGETHGRLLTPLEDLAMELGYSVSQQIVDGAAEGWCDPSHRRIVVNRALPSNARVRVLVHELAHALGVGYQQHGRASAEVIVDTVTYIVCASVGLDVAASSVPYIADWGEMASGETIRCSAALIDQIAGRIEDAISPEGPM